MYICALWKENILKAHQKVQAGKDRRKQCDHLGGKYKGQCLRASAQRTEVYPNKGSQRQREVFATSH